MNKKPKIKLTKNTKITVISCSLIAVSCLLFAFLLDEYVNKNILLIKVVKEFLVGLSGLLGVSVLWEAIGKSNFADELLLKFHVSEKLRKTKIECVYDNFAEIDWNNYLENCSSFKAFLAYGYTWRNNNRSYLKTAIKNCTEKRFIIAFPNYNDDFIVDELNRRFGYVDKNKSVKELIYESVLWFYENGATVYLYNGTLCSSFYIVDDNCFYPMNKHGIEKASVPVIKFHSNGTLYKHVNEDFDRIIQESNLFIPEVNEND